MKNLHPIYNNIKAYFLNTESKFNSKDQESNRKKDDFKVEETILNNKINVIKKF